MTRLREDRGATIVIVAVSMIALLGLVGLAVDVGAIYAERRELGRGADAAALAVAEDCARGVACTQDEAEETADYFADANADDGAAAIQSLVIDFDAQTVRVTTKTIDPADGTDRFKLFFMRALGFDSTTVTATAVTQWGHPRIASAFPLVISECEWHNYLSEGPLGEGHHATLFFHNTMPEEEEGGGCAATPGQDADGDDRLSGGFGWIVSDDDCISTFQNELWLLASTGNNPECSSEDLRRLLLSQTVSIPIFEDLDLRGARGKYLIAGFAAFHVTGYKLGGGPFYSEPPNFECPSAPPAQQARCITGYFSTDISWDGEFGGEDFGVSIVKLIG